MKTKPIAVAKSEQRRVAEQRRAPRNPRVPVFPPAASLLANRLNEIIDADPDPERRWRAYAVLTRLCVMWVAPHPGAWPNVRVDYVQETGLLHFDSEFLRDTVQHMVALFPGGEGLPAELGAGPL